MARALEPMFACDPNVVGTLCVSAPGGTLAAHQLDAIADVVAAHSRAAPPHASVTGRAIRIESIASREIPDALRRLTLAGLGAPRARERAHLRAIAPLDAASPASHARTKGTCALAVGLPRGRASAQQLTGLAVLIRRYGLGGVRVTRDQDLELPNVAFDRLDLVTAGLAAFGLGPSAPIALGGAATARRRAAAAVASP